MLDRIDWNVENVGEVIAPRAVSEGDVDRADHVRTGRRRRARQRVELSVLRRVEHDRPGAARPATPCSTSLSEHATLTGLRIVDLLHRVGVPVDVVHTVIGRGATGAALVESEIDMVCFTGLTRHRPPSARAPRPSD